MADIAIFRINYKSDFILTLNSDAGWMTPFCIKFWTGAPSQAFFAGWDGTTYTHCAPVDGDPTKLTVQFDDHHLPIGDLKFQIAYHFTVADFPTSVEDEVINQSNVIIEVDDAPAQVMLDFNGETAPEIEFSLPAYANEAQRIANEEQRIAHEAIRIVNEESRIAAETTRQQNETQRINNEAQRIRNEEARIAEFAQIKADAIGATDAANSAAALANEKAQLAADKAALADEKAQLAADKASIAQSAATLATEKAQLATDKAALAQSAATLANDKAALAQQKAEYATAQGDYAKAQGDYAKAQAGVIPTDVTRTQTDATFVNGNHDPLFYLSQASSSLAGLMTAAGYTKLNDMPAAQEVNAGLAYDVSVLHPTSGVSGGSTYASLSAALAVIPQDKRKGGMTVKFVLSSDNIYVQYFLTKKQWSASEADWQRLNWEEEVSQLGQEIDDLYADIHGYPEVPIDLSGYEPTIGYITPSNVFLATSSGANYRCYIIPVGDYKNKTIKIVPGISAYQNRIILSFLKENVSSGDSVVYADGYSSVVSLPGEQIITIPEDAEYLYFYKYDTRDTTYDYTPSSVTILSVSSDIYTKQEVNEIAANIETQVKSVQGEVSGIVEYVPIGQNAMVLLGNAYPKTSNKTITSFNNTQVYYYPVVKGNTYKVSSTVSWNDTADAVAFSVNLPTIGGGYDLSLISAASVSNAIIFVAPNNGYVLLLKRSTTNGSIYVPMVIPKPLLGKNIAVLGDSIMQYMGGDVPANTITLKNYDDPSDTTIYQTSEATIVGGILYLTSSLSGGQVTESSIRLDVVNSAQDAIDHNGWEYIKNKLGANSIINCGIGGATYREMGCVTSYPSVNTDELLNTAIRSFPNEIRMLKRLVNDGVRPTPDVIVIWMGVNGTTSFMTDTLKEAMSIPWTTLSDDIAGYEYRRKFYGAIRYGIESLYRAFPNALIMLFSPVMTNRGDLAINSDDPVYRGYSNLKEVAESVKSIAERYSCMFFDALHTIGVVNFALHADTQDGTNQIATGDNLGNIIPRYIDKYGIHPNDAGKKLWGNYLSQVLSSFYFDKA